MKRLYILVLLFLLRVGINAQVSISPSTLSTTISESVEHVYKITVTNNGNTPASIWWQINKGANFPMKWKAYFCDDNFCYTPAIEFCPPTKPNVVPAKTTTSWTFHLDPDNLSTSGKVQLQFFSDATRKTLIAETEKDALVVADKLLSTKNTGRASELRIYPNPVDDFFTIQNDQGVHRVSIYNIVSKEIESFKHISGASYNISDYSKGIYIVSLLDSKGKRIKSIKLSKR